MLWYDLSKVCYENVNGIYILLNHDSLKLGKTTNSSNTKREYERQCGNAKMIFIPTLNADKVETQVLNLLVEFRIKKLYSNVLTELVKIDIESLKKIVEFCIGNCNYIDDEKLCRSINTISDIKIISNRLVITNLIGTLVSNFNVNFSMPMELDNGNYSYLLNHNDLNNYMSFFTN